MAKCGTNGVWQSHLPFNVKVFIWTVAGDYLYELLCEDKVFLLKCVCFAQIDKDIVDINFISCLVAKDMWNFICDSVGFYKQSVETSVSMGVWLCTFEKCLLYISR